MPTPMKKIRLLPVILLFCHISAFSVSPRDIDTAVYNLCKEIMINNPVSFTQESYTELAYLKRNYNLTALKLNDDVYKKSIFNNYYYDKYYLYSKFLDENAIVTEDCLLIPESTEKDVNKVDKLLFYVLYPNSIKMPSNIVSLIDEYASADEFWGPYKMLTTIYYLKKYNYQNLSEVQKKQLSATESRLSDVLYDKYVKDLPWSFYKLQSVKLFKMNKIEKYKDINIDELVQHYKSNKALYFFEDDLKNSQLFNQLSSSEVLQYDARALLWIFLLENK